MEKAMSSKQKSAKKDPKVLATEAIWGISIGLFGICIPLVAITESGLTLPLLVALSAGGGTAAVWLSPDRRQLEEADLAKEIKVLEERVMNLETIYISLPDAEKSFHLTETNGN
jgi:hypothetical protein